MSREMACAYYDNQKCKKFEEPGYTSWCVLGPCAHQTPSNADKIRAMSDEELAEKLIQFVNLEDSIPFCRNLPECEILLDTADGIPEENCTKCLLDWLQQPAETTLATNNNTKEEQC